jgi:hypothetical protein
VTLFSFPGLFLSPAAARRRVPQDLKREMDNLEIEALPVVRIRGAGLSPRERRRRRFLVCVGATVVAIFGALILSNARTVKDSSTFDVVSKFSNGTGTSGTTHTSTKIDCAAVCSALKGSRIETFGGDLVESNDLLKVVTTARDKAISVLKELYGEKIFSAIFEEERGGKMLLRKAVVSANTTTEKSAERFKRKLMIKLLSVQAGLLDAPGCDCLKSNGVKQGRTRRLQDVKSEPKSFARFIWATGGHSAAAGHGNLYNESYTAFMERTVKDVFASVGIDFIGKNYAMGGTASAPEIALCAEAIFGSDPDAVSWDFVSVKRSRECKLVDTTLIKIR